MLIDFARRRQNHFGKKFPHLVSRQFALLRLRLFELCNSLANTIVYHQASGEPLRVITSGLPPLPGETILAKLKEGFILR